MSDSPEIAIRYAQSDEDCIEIHKFLCVLSQPVLLAPIDAQDSIKEVFRVRDEGAALIAEANGHLIGTLGIVAVPWWYNTKVSFFTNRWFFIFPQFHHTGVAARLLGEASAIAHISGLQLVIFSQARRRATAAGTNLHFVSEHVVLPDPVESTTH